MKKAERLREIEETDDIVSEKCKTLCGLLKKSKCTIVYTGAGISTAASIPDYRGPNGVWTLAEKGIAALKCIDPVKSCPTISHMVLKEMCRSRVVHHILSQNCDGLHLRSGLPQKMLSEIHGNMHIEVCQNCDPPRQYVRPFDVTENSQFRRHGTGRYCSVCNNELSDTIVHFGEAGKVPWPLNWNGVIQLMDKCDLILCIGTSLAVLKEYHFLWPKPKSGTQIVIVNLQWTSKDRTSCLKINAKCDIVLEKLANELNIPISRYCRNCDPILNPRRSTRIWELKERITDCSCRNQLPSTDIDETGSERIPGWWSFEIQKALKRSAQVSVRSKHNPKKRSLEAPPEGHVDIKHADRAATEVQSSSQKAVPQSNFTLSESGCSRIVASDVLENNSQFIALEVVEDAPGHVKTVDIDDTGKNSISVDDIDRKIQEKQNKISTASNLDEIEEILGELVLLIDQKQ